MAALKTKRRSKKKSKGPISERAVLFFENKKIKSLENQRFMLDYYSEHGCIDCGEKDPIVLDADHVRGQKAMNISKLVKNASSLEIIKKELEKCEIRCSNCHRRRTAIQQNWYSNLKEHINNNRGKGNSNSLPHHTI